MIKKGTAADEREFAIKFSAKLTNKRPFPPGQIHGGAAGHGINSRTCPCVIAICGLKAAIGAEHAR